MSPHKWGVIRRQPYSSVLNVLLGEKPVEIVISRHKTDSAAARCCPNREGHYVRRLTAEERR